MATQTQIQVNNIVETLQNLEKSNADSGDIARALVVMIDDSDIDYDTVMDLRNILDMALNSAV